MRSILSILILAAIYAFPPVGSKAGEYSSTYKRVIATDTIRCGYIAWPPYLEKDPNTGKLSGISHDYMEALGKELGLEIEWSEEVSWGNYNTGLESGRYDAMCIAVWQSGNRAKISLLTRPVYYNAMYAAVREDDSRFDKRLDAINSEDVKVTVVEGDITQDIREERFPRAQEVALGNQMSDSSQTKMNVITGKADVVLVNKLGLKRFNKNSENDLKLAANGKPVRIFANTLAVKQGAFAMKHMLDSAIGALRTSGREREILNPYMPEFAPVRPGYARKPRIELEN